MTLLTCVALSSCSGYHLTKNQNPFSQYGIYSVAIPMFVNHTVFANMSGSMTKEFILRLGRYPDLKIYPGESEKADAILIGILRTKDHKKDVLKVNSNRFTTGNLLDSIGERQQFNLPTSNIYKVELDLILIKDPSVIDKDLLNKPELLPYLNRHPKIVFIETLEIEGSHSLVVDETTALDKGGITNFTKNKASFEQSVQVLAKKAARDFQNVVLDAF
ncbi:MAG: hypothetical protein HN509_01095 [Halobacteriovoraceae bacterium]|nr:hypothetical protein [Halobacteriovoraceae bacterium]